LPGAGLTRQTVLPTLSATGKSPELCNATPTGRLALKPVSSARRAAAVQQRDQVAALGGPAMVTLDSIQAAYSLKVR
jgi:hypothetical protein